MNKQRRAALDWKQGSPPSLGKRTLNTTGKEERGENVKRVNGVGRKVNTERKPEKKCILRSESRRRKEGRGTD